MRSLSVLVFFGSLLAMIICWSDWIQSRRDPIDESDLQPPSANPSRTYSFIGFALSWLGFVLAGALFLQSCGMSLLSR